MGFVLDWRRRKMLDVSVVAGIEDHLSCLVNYLYVAQRDLERSGAADRALAAVKAANTCTLEIIDLTSKSQLPGGNHHNP
jgi:hypothetical protein